jgi:hypothetical protein
MGETGKLLKGGAYLKAPRAETRDRCRSLRGQREAGCRATPIGGDSGHLDGNARRAIEIHEGDNVDEAALKDLIRAAVALNLKGKRKPRFGRARSKGFAKVRARVRSLYAEGRRAAVGPEQRRRV